MSCGVGYICGSDARLLWLWCRPVATTPIRPLAWEPPYAVGAAPEKTKNKKKEFEFRGTEQRQEPRNPEHCSESLWSDKAVIVFSVGGSCLGLNPTLKKQRPL